MVSLRFLCWYAMFLIFATAIFQFCFDFVKKKRMPSILLSSSDFASGSSDFVVRASGFELDTIAVFEGFRPRLEWREKRCVRSRAVEISDWEVRKRVVSSAYCCNFKDTLPRSRPWIVGIDCSVLAKTSVAITKSNMLSGQPCRIPFVMGIVSLGCDLRSFGLRSR